MYVNMHVKKKFGILFCDGALVQKNTLKECKEAMKRCDDDVTLFIVRWVDTVGWVNINHDVDAS